MKRKKYLLYSWPYNEKVGGVIVLHKICDILNSVGETAYMCPACTLPKMSFFQKIAYSLRHPRRAIHSIGHIFLLCIRYGLNPDWEGKVINPFKLIFSNGLKNYIVLYPELISSNPLNAINITRILMHNPGHFNKEINYGSGELIFRYSENFAKDYKPVHGSIVSPNLLNVSAPPQCYRHTSDDRKRSGIAYALRKGKGKELVHDNRNAILIDDLSMKEVAEIFNKVEMFVSYDPITAFNFYALLCHCPSVIILGKDEKPSTYRTNKDEIDMYAYSIDEASDKDWDIAFTKAERYAEDRDNKNLISAKHYIEETQLFFKNK